MKIAKKVTKNNEEIKLDIGNIAYKDLEGIVRELGWGIIVESGNNNNGNYVKFGDGTMICFTNLSLSNVPMNTNDGALYTTGNLTWNYPAGFVTSPTINIIPRAGALRLFGQQVAVGINSTTFALTGTVSSVISNIVINLIAIGRWK